MVKKPPKAPIKAAPIPKPRKKVPPKKRVKVESKPKAKSVDVIISEGLALAPEVVSTAIQTLSAESAQKGFIELSPEDGGEMGYRNLRQLAGVKYVTDFNGTTISQMAKDPLFSHVAERTLYKWSMADHWGERRRINMEKWSRKLENQISNQLMTTRRAVLVQLDELGKKLLKDIGNKKLKLKAKSLEGAIGAFTRLASLMDELADKVGKELMPDMGSMSSASNILTTNHAKPLLTPEEAREAVRAVLKVRRESMREESKSMREGAVIEAGEHPEG